MNTEKTTRGLNFDGPTLLLQHSFERKLLSPPHQQSRHEELTENGYASRVLGAGGGALPPPSIFDLEFDTIPRFQAFMWHRIVLEASEELWTDHLSRIPGEGFPEPKCSIIANLVKLCELEPETWAYTKPNPDKDRWSAESHLARFSTKIQVVRRQLWEVSPGPLRHNHRRRLVGYDVEIAKLMFKMRHTHEAFHPPQIAAIN